MHRLVSLSSRDDLPPQRAAGAHAVHEQRGRARAELGVGDLAGRGRHGPAVGEESVHVHEMFSYD